MWPNRTACDVLSEMRTAHKTHNYSYLDGLIEELQSMFNKMEAALGDKKDIETFTRDRAELKKEIKTLKKQEYDLKDKITVLEEIIEELEEAKERKLKEIRSI